LNLNQAVPCALILNEIITNSVKHAFKNTENPKIKISLSQKENRIYIKIHDNGVGFPTNFLEDSSSMGVTILQTLCQQLEANLYSENNNGACIRFDFESKTIKGSTSNLVSV
jgi:two-component sensor histidine kinase